MISENRLVIKPKVLVVEGKDEKNFFEKLIEHLGLSDIQVMDIGGKTQLEARLEALIITRGFSNVISIGIIRDADNNPSAAFQSVCAALRHVGMPTPNSSWQFHAGIPKIVVMILPNGNSAGMLEDLCLRAVASDVAMSCVTQYFQCLSNIGITPSNARGLSKAKVQAFLASRRETGVRLGIAALKGYWPLGDQAFAQVRQFLQNL